MSGRGDSVRDNVPVRGPWGRDAGLDGGAGAEASWECGELERLRAELSVAHSALLQTRGLTDNRLVLSMDRDSCSVQIKIRKVDETTGGIYNNDVTMFCLSIWMHPNKDDSPLYSMLAS